MAAKKRQKALSSGRPPLSKTKERMSSQQSRTIIRTHHRLHKEHVAALKTGDTKRAEEIARAIEKNGGLKLYQVASKQGQSKDRGGDSSKMLVEWLREASVIHAEPPLRTQGNEEPKASYRCLEVGALSTLNEISKFPTQIEMTRIDLNSQGPGIQKQDFMQRPLPKSLEEQFDIVSLSLVLNYVPDPVQRGEMLKRVVHFLRKEPSLSALKKHVLPALFLVLPLPCVANSRYLDEALLVQIMVNLGFSLSNKKLTPKLCYYLFSMLGTSEHIKMGKKKAKDGPTMNNFCIIIE